MPSTLPSLQKYLVRWRPGAIEADPPETASLCINERNTSVEATSVVSGVSRLLHSLRNSTFLVLKRLKVEIFWRKREAPPLLFPAERGNRYEGGRRRNLAGRAHSEPTSYTTWHSSQYSWPIFPVSPPGQKLLSQDKPERRHHSQCIHQDRYKAGPLPRNQLRPFSDGCNRPGRHLHKPCLWCQCRAQQ